MPVIQSSIKDVRRTHRRTERNHAERSRVRTLMKAVRRASSPEEAERNLQAAVKAIDKAWARGILKRNTASRYVSRLTRLMARKKNPASVS